MNSNKISESSSEQFKVANHCCCFVKNVTHDFWDCWMCTILLFNGKSKICGLK